MANEQTIIEIAETTNRAALPEDYCLARQLALAGSKDEATRIYWQILTASESAATRGMVLNDLATLAAAAGDETKARELLQEALAIDPQCTAAQQNAIALGMWLPLNGKGGPAHCAPRRAQNRPFPGGAIKVAIVSGMFNWPSSGGGNVHTAQLASALQYSSCHVHHFYLEYEPWSIGSVEENPIHAQPIRFSQSDWSLANMQSRVQAAVRDCAPDVVLLTDSWSLKPWLAEAVSDFPYLLRFDAVECLCPLNNLRLIPRPDLVLEPCTKHRLATPDQCLKCVQEYSRFVGPMHKREREFSRFDTTEYHDRLLQSLASAEAVLVHNPLIAAVLEPYSSNVRVVPIGVDATTFGVIPPLGASHEQNGGIKKILFGGRTRDPIKGFQVLRAASQKLWRTRCDFRIIATGDPSDLGETTEPFMAWQGWQSHDSMPRLLADADIVAAPAVASEPLGLTVIEAMAAGRPVVASHIGGLQFTVVDGLTGLLCKPDNPDDLAEKLSQLLDSGELRTAMGAAGRRRFQSEYSWDVIIDRHYRPLLDLGSLKRNTV